MLNTCIIFIFTIPLLMKAYNSKWRSQFNFSWRNSPVRCFSLFWWNKVSHHVGRPKSSALNFHCRGPKVAENNFLSLSLSLSFSKRKANQKKKKKARKATKKEGIPIQIPYSVLHISKENEEKQKISLPFPPIFVFKWTNFQSLSQIFVWVFVLRLLPWI